MLQNIQYGGGPSVYAYSGSTTTSTNNAMFHVFASQMSGYDSRREKNDSRVSEGKVKKSDEEHEDFLRECYQREYRENNLIRWK